MTREAELLDAQFQRLRAAASPLFARLLVAQWIGAVAWALVASPTSWSGASPQTSPHLWAALVLGGLATLPTIWLVRAHPQWTVTRHAVAVAQLIFSGILIDVSGGRVETHFHIFGSLAILAFYRDPWVLVTGSVVTLVDHAARGALAPATIYGVSSVTVMRTVEHACWIAFEDVMLVAGLCTSVGEMRTMAHQRGALERTQVELARAAETEHHHAVADQLLQAERREVERAVGERTRFLSTMSHELRTPLNAVIGFLDLLSFTSLDETQASHVAGAKTSSRHVLDLVDDFLDHVKLENGRVELWRTPFSVQSAVREATTLVKRVAADKHLALEIAVADDVPAWVLGDALRVRQILVNLLGNAVKFTSQGGVRVRVSVAEGNDSLAFEVDDDGPGISADQESRIFEPFRQADRKTSHQFGGTGLGLSISRQLARKMGGDLGVRSSPGRGSTFRLVLPLPQSEAPTHTTAEVPDGASTRALRVLLADDDPTNRLVGKQLLARLGHTVDLAVDGADALKKLRKRHHDLVVMDVEMPNVDGLEATRALRADGITIPVLGFTAHVDPSHIAACRTAGMDGVVHKPMDLERLSQAIAHVLPAEAIAPVAMATPAPAPSAATIIDLVELRQRVGDDAALYEDVLAAVVTEVQRLTEEMRAADVASDAPALRRAAHTLRGCLSNVGAKELVRELAALEEAAAASDTARTTTLVPPIAARCEEAHRALAQATGTGRRAA